MRCHFIYVNEYYIQSDLTGFLKSINIECVRCKLSLIDVEYSKQNKNHFSSLIGENVHEFLTISSISFGFPLNTYIEIY